MSVNKYLTIQYMLSMSLALIFSGFGYFPCKTFAVSTGDFLLPAFAQFQNQYFHSVFNPLKTKPEITRTHESCDSSLDETPCFDGQIDSNEYYNEISYYEKLYYRKYTPQFACTAKTFSREQLSFILRNLFLRDLMIRNPELFGTPQQIAPELYKRKHRTIDQHTLTILERLIKKEKNKEKDEITNQFPIRTVIEYIASFFYRQSPHQERAASYPSLPVYSRKPTVAQSSIFPRHPQVIYDTSISHGDSKKGFFRYLDSSKQSAAYYTGKQELFLDVKNPNIMLTHLLESSEIPLIESINKIVQASNGMIITSTGTQLQLWRGSPSKDPEYSAPWMQGLGTGSDGDYQIDIRLYDKEELDLDPVTALSEFVFTGEHSKFDWQSYIVFGTEMGLIKIAPLKASACGSIVGKTSVWHPVSSPVSQLIQLNDEGLVIGYENGQICILNLIVNRVIDPWMLELKKKYPSLDPYVEKRSFSFGASHCKPSDNAVSALAPYRKNQIVAGYADGSVILYNRELQPLMYMVGHTKKVHSIVVLSNNDIASASEDGTLRLWDSLSGNNYIMIPFDLQEDNLKITLKLIDGLLNLHLSNGHTYHWQLR